MPKAVTPFYRARGVVALIAFCTLLAMHADAISSTFNAKLLRGSVLADATPHTDPANELIDVVHANSLTTAALALELLLAMRAHLTAATFNTARAPLTMLAKLATTALTTALAQLTVLTN